MSKLIPLSRGLFATVDDADFDWLNQWKWFASRQGRPNANFPKFRAARNELADAGKRRLILMHRQLLAPNEGDVIDHINGNPLDNRRSNLRVCTQAENCLNKNLFQIVAAPRAVTSVHKGVYWKQRDHKWIAQYQRKEIGQYKTEQDAIAARQNYVMGLKR